MDIYVHMEILVHPIAHRHHEDEQKKRQCDAQSMPHTIPPLVLYV